LSTPADRNHGGNVGRRRLGADAIPPYGPSPGDGYVAFLAKLELSEREANALTDEDLVVRLVASGLSRLTGERIVALGRGSLEPGRARPHAQSRR